MSLKGKIVSVSEADITVSTERGEILHIPVPVFSETFVEGQDVELVMFSAGGEAVLREQRAKDLLNQLLKP